MKRFFTSESVTEGHPDKICDQISDAILDAILTDDPDARVAVETSVTTGLVLVSGEITTTTYINVQEIVRNTVKEIGYDRGKYGFDSENLAVLVAIDPQSPDIAMGVDDSLEHEQGAGDQGIMFGYATNETDEYMPITIHLAHKLARKMSEVRKNGTLAYLRPDGKTQVTMEFDDDNQPQRIDSIVISTQHSPEIAQSQIHADIKTHVIDAVIDPNLLDEHTKYYINPTGSFVIGGPQGDAGLTGRKIIVDTYGGVGRHGGGAFSGKDPSKVDRSAAYAARYVAKNVVAAGLADKCEVQVSYAIGIPHPMNIYVETFNTGHVSDEVIVQAIEDQFNLHPKAIIKELDLKRPIYKQTAAYGHFGRSDLDLPWEKLDKVEALKQYL
ncbi:methionine adenosyltransferase [Candidatus Xianfuyuplasma coldseepsis]|uniref:S-adenosylmethionine synthase n=1 Tax=Candidatus Xianfuyuplasma coldseepsis TaxID=2782163 RepID=A0A7L7KNL5_9MOLU|nr:methionine adenosyltransferase [Xianfuyuplasma coldseepsis]QMS84331.1 methionine adenosyltransferase [Xianfuyuplasma coldseepsis]